MNSKEELPDTDVPDLKEYTVDEYNDLLNTYEAKPKEAEQALFTKFGITIIGEDYDELTEESVT